MSHQVQPLNGTLFQSTTPLTTEALKAQKEQIKQEIIAAGGVAYNLSLPETKALPYVIHPGEHIDGIVYGRYHQPQADSFGRGALVVTNERVFLLDKKPMYSRLDEVPFHDISGVSFSRAGFTATITLHTRPGDILIRTFNKRCLKSFVEGVESKIFGPLIGGKAI